MEIRNLITFLQVAERQSFTQAAEVLNYTQSTVSAQIKQLEAELNFSLFDRTYHNITLTEPGKQFYKYAHQIVNTMEEIKTITNSPDENKGLVRFAMAPSICNRLMGETYMTFHKMYPNIAVNIMEGKTDELLRLLSRNEVDLIFISDKHQYNRDYIIMSETKEQMHFVVGKNFDLGGRRKFTIQELAEYPFLLTEKGISYRELFDQELAKKYTEISPLVEIGNTHLLLELVEMGAGITFLPEYITRKSYQEGKVVYLEVEDFEIEIWRQLMCNRNKWISPAMRRVIDYCSKVSENI